MDNKQIVHKALSVTAWRIGQHKTIGHQDIVELNGALINLHKLTDTAALIEKLEGMKREGCTIPQMAFVEGNATDADIEAELADNAIHNAAIDTIIKELGK